MHQELGVPREEPRARSAGDQSGEGLPAARRGVRRRRLRRHAVLRARLAGLRRLLPLAPRAALQGAGLGGVVVDDRGRGGVRRPEQHGRRPRQRLFALRAEDDRRLHHLHGRSDRRRPARVHRNARSRRARCRTDFDVPFAHTPAFVGSHVDGYDNMLKGILEHFWKDRERAARGAGSTSFPASTASASATIASSSGCST